MNDKIEFKIIKSPYGHDILVYYRYSSKIGLFLKKLFGLYDYILVFLANKDYPEDHEGNYTQFFPGQRIMIGGLSILLPNTEWMVENIKTYADLKEFTNKLDTISYNIYKGARGDKY